MQRAAGGRPRDAIRAGLRLGQGRLPVPAAHDRGAVARPAEDGRGGTAAPTSSPRWRRPPGALQEVAVGLLNDHVQHRVVDAAARGSDVEVRARLVEMAATIRQWCGYDPAHLVASGGGAGPSQLPGGDPGRRAAADPGRPPRFTEDGTLPGAAGRGDHQVLPAGVCPHSRDLAGLRACTSSCARARSWVGRGARKSTLGQRLPGFGCRLTSLGHPAHGPQQLRIPDGCRRVGR